MKNYFYTLLVIKYQKKFCIYAFLIHILHPSLLLNNKNYFYTLLVIKYQKKFRIYNFLFISHALHALHSFPTIKKSFLHPPNNKISKEISYLYHISCSSLLSNNKKIILHPSSNKISKNFHIYAFLIHILHTTLLSNNKKSFLHPPSNKISKKISYL